MLGGAAPIPASSGQTVRVRLNRSGDRQLNQALHVVVLTRLRYDPATRAYAQRRRAEGKTNREIRRCLVRYVARQLYRLLEANPRFDPTWERPRGFEHDQCNDDRTSDLQHLVPLAGLDLQPAV
jgi:hypothetical protein